VIDFMRVDACPRCRRGFPDDAREDGADACPVCEGKPVTCLVIWNHALSPHRGVGDAAGMVAAAARAAADMLGRPPGARGSLLRTSIHLDLTELMDAYEAGSGQRVAPGGIEAVLRRIGGAGGER
jgi:hypothetical protein